jgi:predicted amidohydrolase YtcJ
MLDRNLYKIDPTDIDKVKVLLTITDGKVVHEAK